MSITFCALPVNNSRFSQHHPKMLTNVLFYSLHYSQINRVFRFRHCINRIYNQTFSLFLHNTRVITTHSCKHNLYYCCHPLCLVGAFFLMVKCSLTANAMSLCCNTHWHIVSLCARVFVSLTALYLTSSMCSGFSHSVGLNKKTITDISVLS